MPSPPPSGVGSYNTASARSYPPALYFTPRPNNAHRESYRATELPKDRSRCSDYDDSQASFVAPQQKLTCPRTSERRIMLVRIDRCRDELRGVLELPCQVWTTTLFVLDWRKLGTILSRYQQILMRKEGSSSRIRMQPLELHDGLADIKTESSFRPIQAEFGTARSLSPRSTHTQMPERITNKSRV